MHWVVILLTHLDPKFQEGRSHRRSIEMSAPVGLTLSLSLFLSQACLNTTFLIEGAAVCHRLFFEWRFGRIHTAFRDAY